MGRYKRVSHAGGADESLFGSQPAAGSRKVEQMLRQPPAQGDKVEFDSVVITTSDLQRLRMDGDLVPIITNQPAKVIPV